jgi:hypothetical protein
MHAKVPGSHVYGIRALANLALATGMTTADCFELLSIFCCSDGALVLLCCVVLCCVVLCCVVLCCVVLCCVVLCCVVLCCVVLCCVVILFTENDRLHFCNRGGVQLLLDLMERFTYVNEVQIFGSLALANFSLNNGVPNSHTHTHITYHLIRTVVERAYLRLGVWYVAIQQYVSVQKGVRLILRAMTLLPNNIHAQRYCCLALGNLAYDDGMLLRWSLVCIDGVSG